MNLLSFISLEPANSILLHPTWFLESEQKFIPALRLKLIWSLFFFYLCFDLYLNLFWINRGIRLFLPHFILIYFHIFIDVLDRNDRYDCEQSSYGSVWFIISTKYIIYYKNNQPQNRNQQKNKSLIFPITVKIHFKSSLTEDISVHIHISIFVYAYQNWSLITFDIIAGVLPFHECWPCASPLLPFLQFCLFIFPNTVRCSYVMTI